MSERGSASVYGENLCELRAVKCNLRFGIARNGTQRQKFICDLSHRSVKIW